MAQEFINWTIETIRNDKLLGPWLEERKFDWVPLISKAVANIIDKNKRFAQGHIIIAKKL